MVLLLHMLATGAVSLIPPTTTANFMRYGVQLTTRDVAPLEVVAVGPPPLDAIQRRHATIITLWRVGVSSTPGNASITVLTMARGKPGETSTASAEGAGD